MRNGTQSKLTLVDSAGHKIQKKTSMDDVAVEYDTHQTDAEPKLPSTASGLLHNRTLFIAASAVLAAGSIASASYAVWLARHQATQEAITSVQDLLDTCEQRMRQMETDLHKLPPRA